MPKVYRAMYGDHDKPALGEGSCRLSVRVVEGGAKDISPDAKGRVSPQQGGLSVSPGLKALPPHRIPTRLRHLVPGAIGKDTLFIWSSGRGEFREENFAPSLFLRLDPRNTQHGLIEPDQTMLLTHYQDALVATRDAWTVDENIEP